MLDIIPPTFTGSDHEKVEQMGAYITKLYDSINRQTNRGSKSEEGNGSGNTQPKDIVIDATAYAESQTISCDKNFNFIFIGYTSGRNVKLRVKVYFDADPVDVICPLTIFSYPLRTAAFSLLGADTYAVCRRDSWYLTDEPLDIEET